MCCLKRKKQYLLDFSGISTVEGLHAYLKKALSLPEYYGMNWDALYDCLTDMEGKRVEIRISGLNELAAVLPDAAASLMAVLEDFAAYANGVAPGQAVVIQDIPNNGGVVHSD